MNKAFNKAWKIAKNIPEIGEEYDWDGSTCPWCEDNMDWEGGPPSDSWVNTCDGCGGSFTLRQGPHIVVSVNPPYGSDGRII